MKLGRLVRKREWIIAFLMVLLTSFILVIGLIFADYMDIPFGHLTRDITNTFVMGPYLGYISNMGVTMWGAATMSLLIAWYVGKKLGRDPVINRICLFVGILSLVMFVDDFFMLHDWIFYRFFLIDERVVMAVYAIGVFAVAVVYRKRLYRNGLLYLVGAYGFFGLSVFFDRLHETMDLPFHYLLEDGTKFVGIGLWMAFGLSFGLASLLGKFEEASDSEEDKMKAEKSTEENVV